jgi:iron complex transport system ATP-binding protein
MMISINNLCLVRDGKKIINNFSLNVSTGSITVIIGPNGCGKSTLLSAIAGDILPSSGEIKIDNVPLNLYSAKALAKKRAVVIQNPIYTLGFSVRQVIKMAGPADEVMKELALLDITDQAVTTLSGGQIQKVAIAAALAQRTPLLILDEPLSGQDVQSRKRLIKILQSRAQAGNTVVVVAHSDEKNLSWAHKIVKFPLLS